MTHEGQLTWLLGMRVHREQNGDILLGQELYIDGILKRFGFEDCKTVSTPGEGKLTKAMCPKTEKERNEMKHYPIRQVIGSCAYAAVSTRPDIQEATNRVSRYVSDPGEQHWAAAKRILKYLRETQNLGLLFKRTNSKSCTLTGQCDSDWAGDQDTRRSTTAYIFMVNGSPVSWTSKLQPTVALSSVEAEYMAASSAAQEAVHLRNILHALGETQAEPTIIKSDNKGSIQLTENPEHLNRTKHIDVRVHFVRQLCLNKVVKFKYISTNENLADMLTKPLGKTKFSVHRQTVMRELPKQQPTTEKHKILKQLIANYRTGD